MQTNFAPIGQLQTSHTGDNSFWPSFTDIMMVITMIFLMATSLLVVRNWQLVAELQESIAAEQLAAQLIQSTSEENFTLEERLANAEQSNSILRLRILKKDEELVLAKQAMQQQEIQIASMEIENADFKQALNQANKSIASANLEIERINTRNMEIEKQVTNLSAQITRQKTESDKTKKQLASALTDIASLTQSSQTLQQNVASLSEEKQLLNQQIASLSRDKLLLNQEIEESSRKLLALENEYLALRSNTQTEIESLTESGLAQQQNISSLQQEKQLLNQEISSLKQDKLLSNQEIDAYNRQLLALKGEYEVVKSKYDELIKPARSAKGKYIAEVYYIKGNNGEIIRYKQPGDSDFTDLPLSEVEKRLSKLKAEWGKDLYVKIIIPQDSGLTYSEAWDFMRNLLVKYDYYYQEN